MLIHAEFAPEPDAIIVHGKTAAYRLKLPLAMEPLQEYRDRIYSPDVIDLDW